MRKNVLLAAAGLAVLPVVSNAAAPTLGEVLDASGISATGHASASYAYSNNYVAGTTSAPGAFTGQSNSFTFNQAELTLSKLPTEGFGAAVDVFAGQDASKMNNFTAGTSDFNLHQAYVQYATGGLTVIAGKFATLAGAEVASDNLNSNVTRSILFGLQPLTLTGVRAGYKFSDIVTAYAGLNNSAGGATQDNNKQKTTELGVALTPIKDLAVNLTDYIGSEASPSGGRTNLLDAVVSYTLGDLSLGLNADFLNAKDLAVFPYGLPTAALAGGKTSGSGVALYANYQVTSAFRAGIRGEYVNGKQTTAGGVESKAKSKEITLTGDYAATKNFDLLAEVRYDKADVNGANFFFVDNAGSFKGNATTAVIKAIYKF